MGILSRIFSKRPQQAPVATEGVFHSDIQTDGPMEPGNPVFDQMAAIVMAGNTVVGNQRPDGTWDLEIMKDE